MKINIEYVALAAAAAAAVYLVIKAKPGPLASGPLPGSSAGTGSPENLYSGLTLNSIEQQQAANRIRLSRELQNAGDFWM